MNDEKTDYPDPRQRAVAAFHRAFGTPDLIGSPGPLPADRIALRLALIREEGVDELAEALAAGDEVAVADALVDTAYVALGSLVEMGARRAPTLFAPDPSSEKSLLETANGLPGRIAEDLTILENVLLAGNTAVPTRLLETVVDRAEFAFAWAGLDMQPYFDEVQRANMSKLGADSLPVVSRGEALDGAPEGKVLKGPAYSPPDLVTVHVLRTGRAHECDRLVAVSGESQAIGEFLDTAGYTLGEWVSEYEGADGRIHEYMNGPRLEPVGKSINDLLAEYFKIDMARVEAERRALLRRMSEDRS